MTTPVRGSQASGWVGGLYNRDLPIFIQHKALAKETGQRARPLEGCWGDGMHSVPSARGAAQEEATGLLCTRSWTHSSSTDKQTNVCCLQCREAHIWGSDT